MNYEAMMQLAEELNNAAGALETRAKDNFYLAEDVLDFERGLITFPELVERAKEILR